MKLDDSSAIYLFNLFSLNDMNQHHQILCADLTASLNMNLSVSFEKFNPISLRRAKTQCNFRCSERNRVNEYLQYLWQLMIKSMFTPFCSTFQFKVMLQLVVCFPTGQLKSKGELQR